MRAITAPAGARRPKIASAMPPRLYVAEGTPSITGGMAEHRFRMRTAEVEAFAAKLAEAGQAGANSAEAQAIAKDLASKSRREHRDRGRASAAAGPRHRPRYESDVGQRRQDGDLHRSGGGQSGG